MFNIKFKISLAAAVFPVSLLHSVKKKKCILLKYTAPPNECFILISPSYSFMALTGSEDP